MPLQKDAAALMIAVVTAIGLLALPASAGVRVTGADATVVLQVVPRGNGTISSSLPDRTTGSTSCAQNQEPSACVWTFAKGAPIVLTANPDKAKGATFAGWSTSECPGAGDCRLTLEDAQSIVALFSKLTLSVDTTGIKLGDLITSMPPGISCPDTCAADFDAKAPVLLTVKTATGSVLTSFPYGCTSVDGSTCRVTMFDEPQFVGVKFNGAQGPTPPDIVSVSVKVGKTGDGAGRVTATGLDCGNACSASFPYGALAQLTAAPDAGSLFGGWGGICASDSDPVCALPIGPITLVRPKFVKDAPPSAPGPLTSSSNETSITLSWGESRDDVGVKAYEVFVGTEPTPRASTTAATATLGGLACGTSYALSVVATDAAGNRSDATSAQVSTAACPLRVQFLRSKVVRGRHPRLAVRLTATVATKGSGTLLVNGKRAQTTSVVLHAGTNVLVFRLPHGSGRLDTRLILRLLDAKTGPKTLAFRIVVRT